MKKIVTLLKNIVLLFAVFLPTTFLMERLLTTKKTVMGSDYITEPKGGVVVALSICITFLIAFLYNKISKKYL